MRKTVLVLDDDPERESGFAQALNKLPNIQLILRRNSSDFLAEARGDRRIQPLFR